MKLKLLVFVILALFVFAKPTPAQIPANPASDPDMNVRLRFGPGRTTPLTSPNLLDPTLGPIIKYHFGSDAEIDGRAPQLDTMFGGAAGSYANLYQLHEYNGTTLIPSNGIDNWGSTLGGFNGPGTAVKVPQSGYNIGGGYQVSILYLDEVSGDITLTYTAGEQGIVIGYSMHFLNLDITQEIVDLYKQGRTEGKLVALPCGYQLGTIRNELWVSIRDTGTFFDTRSAYDWWQQSISRATSPLVCDLTLPPTLIVPGNGPGGGTKREYTLAEIACTDTSDPEFHSLRPYPASDTCTQNTATDGVWLCGHDLVVKHTYTVGPGDANGGCVTEPDGRQRCTFNVTGSAKVYMDLTRADLPIVGNTEDVPNAITSASGISDAGRVNEYVSWYMNGVISRAEEYFADANSPAGLFKIINYSGPLRKLLPREIQTRARSFLRSQIGSSIHNQIIECGAGSPFPCYDVPNNPPQRLRISDQGSEGDIQFQYTPFSSTEDLASPITLGGKSPAQSGQVKEVRYTPIQNTPANRVGQSEKNLFFAHMQENSQLSALLQNTYLPYGRDGRANSFSKTGELQAKVAQNCELLEAVDNKGDKLYGENLGSGEGSQLEIERAGVPVYEPNLQGEIGYDATFDCTFDPPKIECQDIYDPTLGRIVQVCTTTRPSCSTGIPVAFSVGVITPNADSIWDRLVGAEMSVFRRVFPKFGPNTPVKELDDIPGKTIVSYGSTNHTGGPGAVSGETLAGEPGKERPGTRAELYFPHLGSIQEYFLHGIQEALRPQASGLLPPGIPNAGTGASCPYTDDEVVAAMKAAGLKYGVPWQMLDAIYQTEGLVYRTVGNFVCEANYAGAIGMMQIRTPTYNIVTCESERPANEFAQCAADPSQLSRCDVRGAFELAARILLWNVGQWGYGPGICNDLGDISLSNPSEIRRAGCAYAGYNILTKGVKCFVPGHADQIALRNYANGALSRGEIKACRNGDCGQMDYGDWVCAWVAARTGANYCSTPNNFPIRSTDGT